MIGRTVSATALALGTVFAGSAGAEGFDGAGVTVTAYCCTAPTEPYRFTVPVTATVGDGVEFPAGSIVTLGLSIITSDVDVGSDFIDIRYTMAAVASGGTFNGFVFDFAGSGLPRIAGVSLSPQSSFSAAQVDLDFDADSVFYSVPGLAISEDSRVLIALNFAPPVPEPATAAMFAAGALVAAACGRRRRPERRSAKDTKR